MYSKANMVRAIMLNKVRMTVHNLSMNTTVSSQSYVPTTTKPPTPVAVTFTQLYKVEPSSLQQTPGPIYICNFCSKHS